MTAREFKNNNNNYVAIDLETTGVKLSRDKIIEVGLVKVENGHVKDTFSCIINPGIEVNEDVLKLTGISKKEIANAGYIEDVIEFIEDFCKGFDLLGHNTIFDYAFIKKEINKINAVFEKNGIDTYKIVKKIFEKDEKKNLTDVCKFFNIERKNAHRAFSDAYYTHMAFQEILKKYPEIDINVEKMNVKIKKFIPIRKRTKEDLHKLLNCHKIKCKVCIDRLSESEAKRYIDKINAGIRVFGLE